MKIALSGASGSGKGYVSAYLRDHCGYTVLSSGALFREISMLLFGDEAKSHLNVISQAVRTIDVELPIEATLRGCAEKSDVVFDSVRYISDMSILRAKGFTIWRIEAPERLRLTRLEKRGQLITTEDLGHASEVEISTMSFDAVIYNGPGALAADVQAQIERLIV